jgi:hypothetical protein
MAELLILRFEGAGRTEYEAVNKELGIDMDDPNADWPPGLTMHAAGNDDDGGFVVTEVWASRHDQESFLQQRLGAALAAGGITSPPEVTWVSLLEYRSPKG